MRGPNPRGVYLHRAKANTHHGPQVGVRQDMSVVVHQERVAVDTELEGKQMLAHIIRLVESYSARGTKWLKMGT